MVRLCSLQSAAEPCPELEDVDGPVVDGPVVGFPFPTGGAANAAGAAKAQRTAMTRIFFTAFSSGRETCLQTG
jgi:hypothetical protein